MKSEHIAVAKEVDQLLCMCNQHTHTHTCTHTNFVSYSKACVDTNLQTGQGLVK